ncbi:MAG: LamG-like jellyroll fold domain-containing protein [Crocosphaera sp.]
MMKSNLAEKLIKNYSDRTYQHTVMITHKGTPIAFAMDEQRRLFYAVLDLNDTEGNKGEFDVAYWPENPSQLSFPCEIEQVGYSIVGATRMPVVKLDTRQEAADPTLLLPEEVDPFLSTTARLTADAPFQVFSDNQHIFVFRQAIANNHPDAVYKLNNGAVSGDSSRNDLQKQSDGSNVSVVESTLLCDRFILSGKRLSPNREVRYQRSRHKTNPASQTDGLGSKDMEGNPFYEPTQELAFIRNLSNGGFTVLQLPTQVNGIKRWQFFAHNSDTGRIDAFNLEVAEDGLFNPQGTQLYTSPDPKYRSAVLEREPGNDPFTGAPLIPVSQSTNHAETALAFDGSSYVDVPLSQPWQPTAFTLESWLRPAQKNLPEHSSVFSSSQSGTVDNSFQLESDGSGNYRLNYRQNNSGNSFVLAPINTEWHHLAISYDGTTLRAFINGQEVFAEEVAMSLQFDLFRIGVNRGGIRGFDGEIDELRVWNYARTGYDITGQYLMRLIGNEPGLVAYWRFDEGAGKTAFDQTDNGYDGTIQGNAQWVASEANLGDHAGMRRSSFSLTGRTLVGSLAAKLYYQQEEQATGYDNNRKPMKKNARVMVTAATTDSSGNDPSVAAIDVAISREGRLAGLPDAITLPVLEKPEASGNLTEITNLEGEIRTLTDDIEELGDEIAELRTQISQPISSSNFNFWCTFKAIYTQDGAIIGYFHKAQNGTVTSSTNPNLLASQWKFEFTSQGLTIVNRSDPNMKPLSLPVRTLGENVGEQELKFGYPSPSSVNLENDWVLEHKRENIYELKRRNDAGNPLFYLNGVRSLFYGWFNAVSNPTPTQGLSKGFLQGNATLFKFQLQIEKVGLNELLAEKELLRSQKETQLSQKLEDLGTLSGGQNTEIRLPMRLVHIDTSGLTVNGNLMKFASATNTPTLLDGATGELTLYYRDQSGQFMAAYFQTLVARTRLQFPDNSVTLFARFAGNNAISATISDGSSDDTCNLVITNSDRNITETWNNLPRDPKKLVDILNGTGERPETVTATIVPATYSIKKRSLQVLASVSNDSANVTNGEATIISGRDSVWSANAPGRAYYFGTDSDLLSLPTELLSQTAMKSDLTVETWVNPSDTIDYTARILHHNSDDAAYTLALQEVMGQTNPKTYHVIAGVSQGQTENHQGQRFLKSKETISAESWNHIAMRFRQSYGLRFNGASYLDCGNNQMLDIAEDLTIEVFLQLERTGIHQGIIGKGFLGENLKSVPYQLSIGSDNKLIFTFEDADGGDHTYYSNETLNPWQFYRIAVTRKKGRTQKENPGIKTISYEDADGNTQTKNIEVLESVDVEEWMDIALYINGVQQGDQPTRYNGEASLGNDEPLEIGRCSSSPRQKHYFQGIISEVRLWSTARNQKDLGKKIHGSESGLVSWWQLEDKEGNVATDSKSSNHGKMKGARWVKNPDPQGSPFNLLLNGLPLAAENMGTLPWGNSQLSMAGYQSGGSKTHKFRGILEEVRIWRTLRTDEQIGDNLFTRLKGETKDLLAYYTFDGLSTRADTTELRDNGLRGNHLSLPSNEAARPRIFLSTAPIGNDTAVVRSALAGVETDFHEQIDSTPGVVEYADLQRDNQGNMGGVLKRCYSYLQNGQWQLVTGYKVGNLVTEWIGQAQFDPQVIGYVEGVPPVPSENLVDGIVSTRYNVIENVSNIEVVESETVTYNLSASKEGSFDMGFQAAASYSTGSDDLLITAPLGIGTAKKLVEAQVDVGVSGNFELSNQWSQEESLGTSINRTRSMSVALGGTLEGAESGQQLNPAIGRRVQPGNMGFALVQSQTADIFALRLAHNNALVSFRMLPNPDIPVDWNIISFPINPRYTKQGTLDGRVGYDENGSVVLDPDYANARQYGEYSYYKPKEAYAIQKRIQREEQRLLNYYASQGTEIANTGEIIGATAGVAAGLLAGPLAATGAIAGFGAVMGKALDTKTSLAIPQKFSKRNLVNTYVWTADGGFFAETTETTDVKSEVSSGSFNFSGAVGGSLAVDVEIFSIGFNLAFEASMGGGLNITKTKAKDTEKSFSIEVGVDVPGDLQKTAPDENNEWKPVFDENGNAVTAAGKVDAYRFKTFYLDSSERNFEDLFGKVVDPIWLASDHPNAVALSQANQSDKKPPCWRVFHRVTFVSRILPDFPDPTAAPLESTLKAQNISSNWQLIQKLDPFVRNHTQDLSRFGDAVRRSLQTYLPELVPHSNEIISYLALYYGIES